MALIKDATLNYEANIMSNWANAICSDRTLDQNTLMIEQRCEHTCDQRSDQTGIRL